MTKPQTSIALIADSHELYSSTLSRLLIEAGYSKVILVGSFPRALQELAQNSTFQLAIFDISLSDGNLAEIASLRITYPQMRLAVVAESERREDILSALSAGLHGYLPRSLSLDEATQALATIASAHIYVPPLLSQVQSTDGAGADHPLRSSLRNNEERLTSRQREVIELVISGKTNKQIAQLLQLTEGTVKAHIQAVFRILNVHDRTSLAEFIQASKEGVTVAEER
jgi:DNA-binding NarL/FixJ family response regulator